jgi:hypothetical protein
LDQGNHRQTIVLNWVKNLNKSINREETPISVDKELEQITASSETEKGYTQFLH